MNTDLLLTNAVINHFLSIRGKIRAPIWHREGLKEMCQHHLNITRFVHKLLHIMAKAEHQIIPDLIELWGNSN